MKILAAQHYPQLIEYLPHIKPAPLEWQLVDIRLMRESDRDFTIERVAEIVRSLFHEYQGRIYLCNARELFMLIHWDHHGDSQLLGHTVQSHLPPGSCQVAVRAPTPEGLHALDLLINYHRDTPSLADKRAARRKNVIMVADDDMYIRRLVKHGLEAHATTQEVADGNEVLDAYMRYLPDLLFLDIHMPGRRGTDLLRDVLALDPEAYVIMLSADSSLENVERTVQQWGAKGFLAKPFTKDKLIELTLHAPTFHIGRAPTVFTAGHMPADMF